MDSNVSQPGTIITFYSYKGGTGRSMAVANVACLTARQGAFASQRALVIDWDLEAPGLHRFFARSEQPEHSTRPGIINYFHALRRLLSEEKGLYRKIVSKGWKALDEALPLDEYLVPDVFLGVDFIKAGRFDAEYAELVSSFDWLSFYRQKEFGPTIRAFRNLLATKYAYCLIDSRTGLSDVSGICTMLLPEKLVTVFTPNRQSLEGVLELSIRAVNYRRSSDDLRPLPIFPLPSRIELGEKTLRQQWRTEYQRRFEAVFEQLYGLEGEKFDLTAYFDDVQLPYVSYYAYGENIAVLEERSEAISLRRAYEVFFRRLIEMNSALESSASIQPFRRRRSIEYIDFEIQIGQLQKSDCLLSISSPSGSVTSRVTLPTADPKFQALIGDLERLKTDEDALTRLGRMLFDALFEGRAKDVYVRSLGMLTPEQALRMRVTVAKEQATDLMISRLPWEFLYDPDRGPLALLDATIVRYIRLTAPTPPLTTTLPLKVLLTGAQTAPEVNVGRELAAISEALADLGHQVQLTVEPHLTAKKLQRLLREGFHVWHFVGHAGFDQDGMTGVLFFEAEGGDVEPINANRLGIMLTNSGLRLVVLDACDRARLATGAFSALAPALVRARCPAVIGTQFPTSEQAARAFAEEFYRALAESFPIDACVTEGRKAVVNVVGLGEPDWGLPVIYTNVPDGKLFELSAL